MSEDPKLQKPNLTDLTRRLDHAEPYLFSLAEHKGYVVFMSVDKFSEDTLLKTLALDGVKTLIDARCHPVFAKPEFSHKKIINYMRENKIKYFEYAFYASRQHENSNVKWEKIKTAYKEIEDLLQLGLAICIYDSDSAAAGWPMEVRHICAKSHSRFVELHPKALAGIKRK